MRRTTKEFLINFWLCSRTWSWRFLKKSGTYIACLKVSLSSVIRWSLEALRSNKSAKTYSLRNLPQSLSHQFLHQICMFHSIISKPEVKCIKSTSRFPCTNWTSWINLMHLCISISCYHLLKTKLIQETLSLFLTWFSLSSSTSVSQHPGPRRNTK